ncbi:hypothetical protein B5D77_17525 [Microcystis sp. MC19]|nr:hypothetical protein B5D77_17525 [Microcystis sp. MC19]
MVEIILTSLMDKSVILPPVRIMEPDNRKHRVVALLLVVVILFILTSLVAAPLERLQLQEYSQQRYQNPAIFYHFWY